MLVELCEVHAGIATHAVAGIHPQALADATQVAERAVIDGPLLLIIPQAANAAVVLCHALPAAAAFRCMPCMVLSETPAAVTATVKTDPRCCIATHTPLKSSHPQCWISKGRQLSGRKLLQSEKWCCAELAGRTCSSLAQAALHADHVHHMRLLKAMVFCLIMTVPAGVHTLAARCYHLAPAAAHGNIVSEQGMHHRWSMYGGEIPQHALSAIPYAGQQNTS